MCQSGVFDRWTDNLSLIHSLSTAHTAVRHNLFVSNSVSSLLARRSNSHPQSRCLRLVCTQNLVQRLSATNLIYALGCIVIELHWILFIVWWPPSALVEKRVETTDRPTPVDRTENMQTMDKIISRKFRNAISLCHLYNPRDNFDHAKHAHWTPQAKRSACVRVCLFVFGWQGLCHDTDGRRIQCCFKV